MFQNAFGKTRRIRREFERWPVFVHQLRQVTDANEIEKAVNEVIAANPDKATLAKAKPAMLGWFVGQVMKASGGKANPQAVNALLRERLGIE